MKKKYSLLFYIALIALSTMFLLLIHNIGAQTYIPITNYHNGISIGLQGTQGDDYIFDRYYYDPLVNDCGLCYIKSDVPITLAHNQYNSRIDRSSTVIIGGDFGIIRYKIDQDFLRGVYFAGDDGPEGEGRTVFPAYTSPVSLNNMNYHSGESVVGNIGFSTTDLTDRDNLYSKGMLDAAGNEYHYLTYADDDDAEPNWKNLEMSASDGKSMLFCVNPKTPAIWLVPIDSQAEYYTTPAKTWWVPKIFEQTSYLTDDVNINLKNIMNSNLVYYRIDGSAYQAYTGPINSNTLSDGEHTLEFYYDPAYVQSRKIIKNPDHPSKQDVFENGGQRGYLLWKDDAEFLRTKDRLLNGYFATNYADFRDDELAPELDYIGNNGLRNQDVVKTAVGFAIVAVIEGVPNNLDYMEAAKIRLLNNKRMHIENIGFELNHAADPNPGHELTYRGYYDDWLLYGNAFAYDLVAKYYRSDQYPNGITPIQDLRLRDMLAVPAQEGLMNFGGFTMNSDPAIDPGPNTGMWTTAHQEAAVVAALAMPSYNTNYLGTSGFDGSSASHNWTPYADYPESWKDVYLTYTDKDNAGHVAMLHPFPNRKAFFNWFDGTIDDGLIRADGNWHDRTGYGSESCMGHGFEFFYNVMKRKFDMSYPNMDLYMAKSVVGEVWCYKDGAYGTYPRRCMANEYFPDLAPQVIDFDPEGKYFYRTRPYYMFFHNPDWASVTFCESTEPPTVPTNLNGTAEETIVSLSWAASTHAECNVSGYNILRDGAIIATVTGTQYIDAGLERGVQYEYTVAAISEGGIESAESAPLQLTTLTDDILPTIAHAHTTVYNTELIIEFSENMDVATSETISNYAIDNGIFVSAAQLQTDQKTVILTVSILSSGIQYIVTVNNVEDANGNTIAANSTASFEFTDPTSQYNLALNRPVTFSAEQVGNEASKLVNGDTADEGRWSAENFPQWVEIDLGTNCDISRMELYPTWSRDYQYSIEAKPDGGSYSIVVDRSANTEGTTVIVDYVSTIARYIKITVSGAATYGGSWISINELEVYGLPGEAVEVTGVTLSPDTINISVGQTSALAETVLPINATNKTVSWSSDNTSIAIVDANGVITAVAEGTATITVTTNDGGFTANCNVTVTPLVITEFYCDPVNGSMSNDGSLASPWSSLEDVFNNGKIFAAGDVINLLSGYHGSVSITGNNADHVIIQAAPGSQPTLQNVSLSDASFWTISGLIISPEFAPVYERMTVLHLGNSENIIVENCEVYSVDDISSWTENDWVDLSCYGIYLESDNNTIRNCIVRNIDFGISLERYADYNVVENNLISNFSGDGMRVLGDYNTVTGNTIQDNYNVDDNHDDAIQSYSIDENWVVGGSTVYGNIISGNTFIQTTDPSRPYQGSLQGLGLFDGMFEDWVIENNVIICDVYHGIAIYGGINCKVINNTVIDGNSTAPVPWILITAHKDGTQSSGNIVRNNLAMDIRVDANSGDVDHNTIITYDDFSSYFADYANFDVQLVSGAAAIDAGSETDAPSTDINGVSRPQGSAYDIGAYEFVGSSSVPVTGVTVSPSSLSLSSGVSQSSVDPVFFWDMETETATITRGTGIPHYDANATRSTESPYQGAYSLRTEGAWPAATFDNETYNEVWAPVSQGTVELYWQYIAPWDARMLFQMTGKSRNHLPEFDTDDGVSLRMLSEGVFQVGMGWTDAAGSWHTAFARNDWTPVTMVDGRWYKFVVRYEVGRGLSLEVDGAEVVSSNNPLGQTECPVWHQLLIGNDRTATGIQFIDNFKVYDHWLGDDIINDPETYQLTETVLPANATDKSVTWSSSNPSIATVDPNGLATAVSAGNASITVTTNDGGYTAVCSVVVDGTPQIGVTGVSVAPTNLSLIPGQTSDLSVSVVPVDATNNSVIWSSSDNSVVTVDENGIVDAVSEGIATITVTTIDGGFTANCEVTVNEIPTSGIYRALNANGNAVTIDGIDFEAGTTANFSTNGNSYSVDTEPIPTASAEKAEMLKSFIYLGNSTFTASFSSVPNADYEIYVYVYEDNSSIATNGTISIEGILVESGISSGGAGQWTKYGPYNVSVVDGSIDFSFSSTGSLLISGFEIYNVPENIPVTGISVSQSTLTLDEGQAFNLDKTIVPVDATDQSVVWSSSDAAVATVDAYGVVSALSGGQTIVTVMTNDGGYSATCDVTVNVPVISVTGVSVSATSLTLVEGETSVLIETITPVDATEQGVTWSSGDTSIATVDANGLVTAIAEGSAVITVTTYEGQYTATCDVTVVVPVTSVSVSPTSLILDEGETSDLTEAITPVNATNQSVIWSSGNTAIAIVDANGQVTAIATGTTTITVTTTDGGYTATCNVTVNEPVTGGFIETFGTGTGDISEYIGWDNGSPILYSGAYEYPGGCSVEETPISEGYPGASGGSNIHIKPGYNGSAWFQVDGINTTGLTDVSLSFGMAYESWSAVDNLTVQVSTDGTNWATLPFTAVGGTTWELITTTGVPESSTLSLKFEEFTRKAIYIDDIIISATSQKSLSTNLDKSKDFNKLNIKICPNPVVRNNLRVAIDGMDSNEVLTLSIFDITGKMLYTDRRNVFSTNTGYSEFSIINTFRKGMYILKIENGKITQQTKFIVR